MLSTENENTCAWILKNFYPGTPLNRYKYMKMPPSIFPKHVTKQYDLRNKAKNGFIYLEIRRAIYGLPQAGALANKQLKEQLAPAAYYEVRHILGLW